MPGLIPRFFDLISAFSSDNLPYTSDMKTFLKLLVSVTILSGCARADLSTPPDDLVPLQDQTGAPQTISLSSPDFEPGGPLAMRFSFDQFGCTGENEAPVLEWVGAPKGTLSYALIVHDPDAPTGVGFFHRVVINLPADANALGAELPPGAMELHTDYGSAGYGGPCPPPGPEHRYVFSLYALDVARIELPEGATGALTRFMLREHAIARGQLVGTFAR